MARWEAVKLAGRRHIQVAAGLCLLAPFVFSAGLRLQSGVPADTLFGRQVLESGFATPLVVLGAAGWLLPLLAALVAADSFAVEDRAGMWPMLLLRSRSRGQLFVGKALVAVVGTCVLVGLLAAGSVLAGVLVIGHQPLIGLSGTLLSPGRCLLLVLASWAAVLPAVVSFGALGVLLSVRTRSSTAAFAGPMVAALLSALLSLVQGADLLRHLLPGTPLELWHGLFASPQFLGPLVQGLLLSVGFTCILLFAAWTGFAGRDEAGG